MKVCLKYENCCSKDTKQALNLIILAPYTFLKSLLQLPYIIMIVCLLLSQKPVIFISLFTIYLKEQLL